MIDRDHMKAATNIETPEHRYDETALLDMANRYAERCLVRVLNGDTPGNNALGVMFASGFDLGVKAADVERAASAQPSVRPVA